MIDIYARRKIGIWKEQLGTHLENLGHVQPIYLSQPTPNAEQHLQPKNSQKLQYYTKEMADAAAPKPDNSKFSISIWPSSQRIRDAVIVRLSENLSSSDSNHY
ncbi:hypothetical protein CFP56_022989 [Quercus suber]|uniref:Uncharacterized protein n=1 Tax=Quercus suber TaxID=58331 RepID=A0AAW0KA74_QUESU